MAASNFVICCLLTATIFLTASHSQENFTLPDFSQPVSPRDYQRALRQGFDTHYFKSKNGRLEPTPGRDYNPKNIEDVYEKGFRNLHLRVATQFYTPPYEDHFFASFISKLHEVVDKCLEIGVAPVITWIHHEAEAYPNDTNRADYINWWTKVATAMRNKSYHLSFNLFTELETDYCRKNDTAPCGESLSEKPDLYNNWTSSVISAIRATGGNNEKRILILASPIKTPDGLHMIDENIYRNDNYTMVEWHDYASGPFKKPQCIYRCPDGECEYTWSGGGSGIQRQILKDDLNISKNFELSSGQVSYCAEWMPNDFKYGDITEEDAISFSHFYVRELKKAGIPWSLNVLYRFYDTVNSRWRTENQYFKNTPINMSRVLDHIVEEMNNN